MGKSVPVPPNYSEWANRSQFHQIILNGQIGPNSTKYLLYGQIGPSSTKYLLFPVLRMFSIGVPPSIAFNLQGMSIASKAMKHISQICNKIIPTMFSMGVPQSKPMKRIPLHHVTLQSPECLVPGLFSKGISLISLTCVNKHCK